MRRNMGNKQYSSHGRWDQTEATYKPCGPGESPKNVKRDRLTGSVWWFDWPLEWEIEGDDEIEWPF